MAENDQRRYWVALSCVRGIGAVRLQRLLAFFGDARTAWLAAPRELAQAGLGSTLVDRLVHTRSRLDPDRLWDSIQGLGIQVITLLDEVYPVHLREVENPPPVLFMRGEVVPADEWAVAVVGTRRVTPYGRQVAEELAGGLAESGIAVVSGLARGVDTIAHREALRAGGRTMAILGSGVDQIYPPENRRLAVSIASRGALLSDYPPGTPPEAANFPPRNRIIAGLSLAVVVVEAGLRSGALITARFAADQGREVFAVPGGIYSPQSQGCNDLIAQGARPLVRPQDVLATLDLVRVVERQSVRSVLPGDAVEAQLYELLGFEPQHIDEICVQAQLPVEQVSATLTMLELKGLVRKVEGMRYVLMRGAPKEDARPGFSV